MALAPRTLAIIGAEGFVASHLRGYLTSANDRMAVQSLSRETFDLTRPAEWHSLAQGTEVVVHAAARMSGPLYDVYNTNALSAHHLVDFLNARGVRRLIYFSSGAIYGPTSSRTTPSTPPAPEGAYAVSKYLAEQKFLERFSGQVNILRLYFPYGPGQRAPRLVPRIVKLIEERQTVRCNPDGGPWVSLTHVEDICKVVADYVLRDDGAPEIVNIAPREPVSLRSLAEAIGSVVGKRPVFDFSGQALDCTSAPWPNMVWRDLDVESVLRPGKRAGWSSL